MSVVISGYEVRVWFLAGLEIWIHSWKTYTTDDIIWHPGYWIYTETYTTVDLFFFWYAPPLSVDDTCFFPKLDLQTDRFTIPSQCMQLRAFGRES
jgi:hypothetical protein